MNEDPAVVVVPNLTQTRARPPQGLRAHLQVAQFSEVYGIQEKHLELGHCSPHTGSFKVLILGGWGTLLALKDQPEEAALQADRPPC